jgi:hypothetical protein
VFFVLLVPLLVLLQWASDLTAGSVRR